jgi:hypothetical protein
LVVGEPIEVPKEAPGDTLEQARQELERRLSVLEAQAIRVLEQSNDPSDSNARTIRTP